MLVYHLTGLPDSVAAGGVKFAGTAADAKATTRQVPQGWRTDVRIELRDVPTDKGGVLALLAAMYSEHRPPFLQLDPLRTWRLSPSRGGWRECPNGE